MSLYERLAATADRMLGAYGVSATLSHTTPLGAVATSTVSVVTVDTVRHVLGDSGVDIGDERLIVNADAAPVKGDRIDYADQSRVVVQVEPIRPAGTVLAWWVWARRG